MYLESPTLHKSGIGTNDNYFFGRELLAGGHEGSDGVGKSCDHEGAGLDM
jgi:hypothetical protein